MENKYNTFCKKEKISLNIGRIKVFLQAEIFVFGESLDYQILIE